MEISDPLDVREIAQLRERLRLSEETGEVSLLDDAYAEDAVIMAPYTPMVEGRAACLEFARTLLASLAREFERQVIVTSLELMILGDIAIDRGTFGQILVPREGGDPIHETGRYLCVHGRSDDGRWRVRRIIWNMESSSEDEPPDGTDAVGGEFADHLPE